MDFITKGTKGTKTNHQRWLVSNGFLFEFFAPFAVQIESLYAIYIARTAAHVALPSEKPTFRRQTNPQKKKNHGRQIPEV